MAARLTNPDSFPGIIRRLACMAYDAMLLLGILAVALLLPHVFIGHWLHRVAAPSLLWAHLFLVLLVYFCWFWTHSGQTLAMKTWRIRVIERDGRPLQPLRALVRFLLCWPSIGLFGIGLLWALVDRDRQFLHDRLAGTRVVSTGDSA